MPLPSRSRSSVGLALALALAAFAGTGVRADAAPADHLGDTAPEVEVASPVTTPRIPTASITLPEGPIEQAASMVAATYWEAVEAAVAADRAAKARAAAEEAARARAAALPPAPAGSIDEIIQRHFGAAAGQARAIAVCESNLNPRAVSPTNDHGLFQINTVHRNQFPAVTGHPWSAVYDPEINARYAKWLYDREGWRPWTCRKVL